jgi:hypothetical protein
MAVQQPPGAVIEVLNEVINVLGEAVKVLSEHTRTVHTDFHYATVRGQIGARE